MKVDFPVTTLSSTQFRVISIEKLHSANKYCVRGSRCEGTHLSVPGTYSLAGAVAEYLAEYRLSTPPPVTYHFCESCLTVDIGWLRMEKVKLELSRE